MPFIIYSIYYSSFFDKGKEQNGETNVYRRFYEFDDVESVSNQKESSSKQSVLGWKIGKSILQQMHK